MSRSRLCLKLGPTLLTVLQRRSFRLGVLAACWAYLATLLAILLLLRLAGDLYWPATLILFAPRGILGLPLLFAFPAAILLQRHALWPLLAAGLLWLFPIMGVRAPLLPAGVVRVAPLRLITMNLGQDRVAPHSLLQLIRNLDADLVMLQECPEEYPAQWPADWHVQRAGQLVIASRYPLDAVEVSQRLLPPRSWLPVNGLLVRAHLPSKPIVVACVHLTSPREGLAEVLDRHTGVSLVRVDKIVENLLTRRIEANALAEWVARADRPLLIGGDFNMPVDSRIFREAWSQHQNAFDEVGFGFGHTKFEPIGPSEYGIRIDHVLAAAECQFVSCWVGPDLGSDHRPLIVDVVVSGN